MLDRGSVERALICAIVLVAVAGPIQAGEGPIEATGLSADSFHSPDSQLRQMIEILLEENPELGSAWARSRSRIERAPQVGSLPDPRLSYRYHARSPETRVGPQEHALELSQGLPWRGKRRLQAERARTLASGSSWEAEQLERSLVADLKRAYFDAAYLQESLTVNAEKRELLRRFESIALKRYATGEGIQQSVVKVQTDISRLEDRDTELRERLGGTLRRMAELIGRPESDVALERIVVGIPDVEYDAAELEEMAISRHPSAQAVERRIEADRLWSKRRALESRPDFTLGLGYTQVGDREDAGAILAPPEDNGRDIVALTVGIDIPIRGRRIRAGVSEAEESRRANQDLLRSVQNRLRFRIQEATLRLNAIGERARLYQEVIIPQAEESLASAEAAYTTNRQDFLDLLDAERIVFEVRLAYHRLVADYWIALADLELAVGQPFPSTASPAGKEARS